MLHVLQHSLGRDEHGKPRFGSADYRNYFCAGEGSDDFAACREAVAQGLMEEHPPRAISGGEFIFTATDAGKAYVAANSAPAPKLSRGQLRYRAWLASAAADCGVTFGEWLRSMTRRNVHGHSSGGDGT